MQKNLLLAGGLVVLAGVGIGLVIVLPWLQQEDKPPVAPSKSMSIAKLPNKVEPKPLTIPVKPKDIGPIPPKKEPPPAEKKNVPDPKKIEPKIDDGTKKTDDKKKPNPVDPDPKKIEVKFDSKEKKVEVKVEPKKPAAKIIALGDDLIKLNDADGEYTVKPLYRGIKVKIIGVIKTLKIAGASERSELDVSGLAADETHFTGNLNSGAKVLLGKTGKLVIRDVNDKSEIDGSACDAREITVAGSFNLLAVVKLHAPGGTVEFANQVNDRSTVEVAAPEGKIVFKSTGAIANSQSTIKLAAAGGSVTIAGQINGSTLDVAASRGKVLLTTFNADAQANIVAKDVEVRDAINGNKTQLTITLTRDGSLKFRTLNSEARLHWRKADAADPAPRIEPGVIGARAQFGMLPPPK